MRILALEPYHGGSHRAFLDGWQAHSRHAWTVLGLPAHKWKWRMRHAAVTFADAVAERVQRGESWDAVLCSDMLNLAEFLGLAPEPVRALPRIAYFHENQLTYPVRHEDERDYQFAFTNMTTALAADRVWFNSAFHRDEFLAALEGLLRRMPDHQPLDAVGRISAKSEIRPQGIHPFPPRGERAPGPLRILWAARWEHDKGPDTLFDALRLLAEGGVSFRLSVIGEQFRQVPPVFEQARAAFGDRIDRWGYQESRAEYEAALREADVVVSTARHEFFGVSVVEAIAAGCRPLLPERLAYPEILRLNENPAARAFFYDGTAAALAERLEALSARLASGSVWPDEAARAACDMSRFHWPRLAPELDAAVRRPA